MTVSTEISSNEYTGNGVTTDFDYKFRIFKANQLSVITSDADGDNVVTLRLGTDYTVTGANKSAGGKVILTKPLANGHKISIARDIPITQETSFRNQSKFFAETHEDAFDYLTMIIQRIWGSLGSLYLKRPNILANWFDAKGYRISNLGKPKRDSDAVDLGTLKDEISGVNSTILKREKRVFRVDDMDIAALPKASERAGNVLTFDKDGKPIVVAPASGSAVDVLNQLANGNGSLIGIGNGESLGDIISNSEDGVHDKAKQVFSKEALTISTWNIQSYEVINLRYGRDMTDSQRFFDLSDFISKSGSHIVCMQECYNGVGAEMSNLATGMYTDSYFGQEEKRPKNSAMMTGYFAGNSVISRYKTHDSNTIRITDEGGYHRVATASYIDHPEFGKIAIYNVHSGWFEANNLDFYNRIISDYKSKGINRVVICGDFNHDNSQWFSPLFAEGFIAVNSKTYNTKNTSDGSAWYIDNILYKGFSAENVSVYSPDLTLSDHKMLTVTLK